MMHMTFYWGKTVTILFDFWRTDSWISYALTLLACLIFSIFYQYLEDRRLRFKLLSSNKTTGIPQSIDGINPTTTAATPLIPVRKVGKLTGTRILRSVLFGVNSAIGYLLMLSVMSFNGGVFIAIVLGLSLGYLIFRSGEQEEDVVAVDSPCACS